VKSIDIFPWDEAFATGLGEIDDQHRRLVDLLNRLATQIAFGGDKVDLDEIFADLVDYACYHFQTEEGIWHDHIPGDELEASHLKTHQGFIEALNRLQTARGSRQLNEVADEVLGFLAEWLAAHILESDRLLARVVIGLQAELTLDEAKQAARSYMAGATRRLIDVVLATYRTLSVSTLRLMREIAQKERASDEVHMAREMLQAAVGAGGVFPWKWDVDADRLTWGFSPESLLGPLPPGQTRHGDFREMVHPDDRAGFLAAGQAAIATLGEYTQEFRIVTTSGEVHWLAARGKVERDPAEGGMRMIGATVDITARKRMEEELAHTMRLLREAIESIAEGFTIYDQNDRLVICNEAYLRIYNTSRDLIVPGASFEDIVRKGAERGQYRAAIGRIDAWVAERVRQHQSADGRPIEQMLDDGRWLLIIEYRTPSGYIVGNRIDITARKHAELALEGHRQRLEQEVADRTSALSQAKEAAEAANNAKSAFLANMSHEIRTPLNAITGFSDLIRRAGLSAIQTAWMDKHDTAVTHLLEVIDAVLDLSKIEAQKLELDAKPIRLEDLLANVIAMVLVRAESKGLRLELEIPAPIPDLVGDPTRLQQALLNYVGNAIKFTEAGKIALRATVDDETTDSALIRFEVEDTGIGVDPTVLPRLFNAFEQADNSTTRRYGGSGLGLAITRRLANLMRGTAGARSLPGEGSVFWFTARLAKGDRPLLPPLPQPSTDVELHLPREFAGTRVLVAEDDAVSRELAQILLQDLGLVAELAEDGLKAVACAQQSAYALILMDMQMPGLNGLEATRQIRAIPAHARTPILAVTANVFAEDRRRCLEAGMNDFVAKPLMPGVLYQQILKWLEIKAT
jgi:hemerythrin-like metal-binding protein